MDKQLLRRKLLRGSLAAPVVLTVSSASTAAAASFARCLRSGDTGASSPFFTPTTDNWYRKQVSVSNLWSSGKDQGTYFLDQVKNVWVNVNPPYTALSFGAYMPPGWTVSSTSKRWALVWFDKFSTTQYSKITLQKPWGSCATTMSCYGSFSKG